VQQTGVQCAENLLTQVVELKHADERAVHGQREQRRKRRRLLRQRRSQQP
jgi:hypothetical protein